jgi:hypothetical protein
MKKPLLLNKKGEALTLWFREHEQELIANQQITSSIRFGDRTAQTLDQKGGYKVGSIIKLLILKANGEFADFESRVKIESVVTKQMFQLTKADFKGAPQDQNNRTVLCTAFRKYYGEMLCRNELVSIISFSYLK